MEIKQERMVQLRPFKSGLTRITLTLTRVDIIQAVREAFIEQLKDDIPNSARVTTRRLVDDARLSVLEDITDENTVQIHFDIEG